MTQTENSSRTELPETWLDDDPDYDPYKVFDRHAAGAGRVDPYPRFAEFRELGGVVRIAPTNTGTELVREWRPGDPEEPITFGMYSYDAVTAGLRDWKRFTSTAYAETMGLVFGHSILEMDPPEHDQHRSLVAQAFRPKVLHFWEQELLRPVIQEQIDSFKGRGEAELTQEFNLVYPVKVISGMIGVPLEHSDWFRRRAIEEISLEVNIERGLEASSVLRKYFKQIIALRREQKEPGNDLISELVHAELQGHSLSDEEILPFLLLLAPAGAETTYRSTGNLLYGLLTNTEQLKAVKEDRSLVPAAVEEAIRWESPLTGIGRKSTTDSVVNGVAIPAGAEIAMCIGSANRDASVWGEDAEEFNVFRAPKQHVAFAHGRHTCLGMHLARMEMGLALNMLLDQLPDIQLDPDTVDDTYIDGQVFRSPNQLRVRFTPVR